MSAAGDDGAGEQQQPTPATPAWLQRDLPARDALVVLTFFVLTAVVFGAMMHLRRNAIIDDAYISFRYARHLADGAGLRWNRGEAPVEGYSNLLLVLGVAPFLRAGFDPVRVVQWASVASLFACAVPLARIARRCFDASATAAIIVGLSFVSLAHAASVCAMGLETVPFTFSAVLSVDLGLRAFAAPSLRRWGAWYVSVFVSSLLRPEAFLLLAVCLLAFAWDGGWRRLRERPFALATAAFLAAPTAAYLAWKLAYFGTIIPNPALIKASRPTFFSEVGFESVVSYFDSVPLLVAAALGALALRPPPANEEGRAALRIAWGGTIAFSLFFLRVDTWMDDNHRFLYPVTPLLWLAAMPFTVRAVERARAAWGSSLVAAGATVAVLGLLLFGAPRQNWTVLVESARGTDPAGRPDFLLRREEDLGRKLARFPGIRDVTIAFGDAGALAYFTDARFIDTIGLNDRAIPRMPPENVVRYIAGRQPTILITVTRRDLSPFLGSHGSGAGHDPNQNPDWHFERFDYAGTVMTSWYDLHLLVRRDAPQRDALMAFLRHGVVDGVHRRLPFPARIPP